MAVKRRTAKKARSRHSSGALRSARRSSAARHRGKSASTRSKPVMKSGTRKVVNDLAYPIVAIGGSAGGFEAAMDLLKNLPPENNNMAFVIVQHLDPHHASGLPKLLARGTRMPVIEIKKAIHPAPNTVYVLPANKGLAYKKGKLFLTPMLPRRPTLAIDRFFESLAEGA